MKDEVTPLRPTRTKGRDATTGVIPGRFALSVGIPDLPVPSGWRWTYLSDVAQLESGHTPSRRHPEYWDGDIPWIGIKDAVAHHGRVIQDTIQHVTELGLENSSARLLPTDTVCLSRTASVGYVTIMGCPMATSQDFVNWVCGPNIDPGFLKAVLFLEQESLWRFASGTTHQTIYYPEAKAFAVCLPPIEEQRAIAHILGTLDDKIELNRRMNETLEEIARTIFTSWFVTFDPVRAKAEGRQPEGMDAETTALFPDSFVDSELGEIPSGWHSSQLGEEFNITMGQSPPGSTYNHDSIGLPFYQGRADFGIRFPGRRVFCTGPTRLANEGDTLLSVRAPVGDINLAIEQCAIGRGVAAIRHKSGSSGFTFQTLRTLQSALKVFESEGTVFGAVNKQSLHNIALVAPTSEVVVKFEELCGPIDRLIEQNVLESRTLAEIRDTLLPKLLSGEVRVNEAESLVSSQV